MAPPQQQQADSQKGTTDSWIGRTFSWITQRAGHFRDWPLALIAIVLLFGLPKCGNSTYLDKGTLKAIIDTQDTDGDGCFAHVYQLQDAVERSYRQTGMFRESVLEYSYKINLPVPDPAWPDHVKARMTICGMKYGPGLLEAGMHDGDKHRVLLRVLLARDRKDPNFWHVLEIEMI